MHLRKLKQAFRLCFGLVQVGEAFGPVRALAEGKSGELFIGTTKNAIIKGAFPDTLTPIVQVGTHTHSAKHTNMQIFTCKLACKRSCLMLQGHTDELWGLDSHPSMEQFVTCSQDKQVYLWDTHSHQPLWSKTIEVMRSSLAICLYLTFILHERGIK